eukprot:TRINITY_DN2480_c0_g1_i1.p2 TRINITY_DN2480_c0_g1~~TRINITY_DN2480_c0_g1_i1.p2  ORF type:complete len:353 (-),score=97.09 TRINITY_DN2480_c0_g1_i1:1299-2276(-)
MSADADTLITTIALRLSRAMNLEKPNRALAKDVIRKAQRTDDFKVFREEAEEDGVEGEELQHSIFQQVKGFIQTVRDEERLKKNGGVRSNIEVDGFSTAVDHLDRGKGGGEGGLFIVKSEPRGDFVGDDDDEEGKKPVFRLPDKPQKSLLGLDALAKVKREEKELERTHSRSRDYRDERDRDRGRDRDGGYRRDRDRDGRGSRYGDGDRDRDRGRDRGGRYTKSDREHDRSRGGSSGGGREIRKRKGLVVAGEEEVEVKEEMLKSWRGKGVSLIVNFTTMTMPLMRVRIPFSLTTRKYECLRKHLGSVISMAISRLRNRVRLVEI